MRFSTDHLRAERRSAADFDDLRRLHQDPRAMATLAADGRPLPAEQTRQSLQASLDHWERYGYGIWTFRARADGQFVGYCGLRHSQVAGRPEVELLYALLPDYWGRGLATEAASAVVQWAFDEHGLVEIWASTQAANTRSRRVMEKIGMTRDPRDDFDHPLLAEGHPLRRHVLYRAARPRDSGPP